MSSNGLRRLGSPGVPVQRPTAKRSPSILVTDVRSHTLKGARAPFAGHNFRKQQQQQEQQQQQQQMSLPLHSFDQQLHQSALQKRLAFRNKYTDISVDKLLSNSSDIPSGQSRLPLFISSTNRRGNNSPSLQMQQQHHHQSQPSTLHLNNQQTRNLIDQKDQKPIEKRNIRSIPKLSQSLPARTSKTSQRLVLIPDQRLGSPPLLNHQQQQPSGSSDQIHRSRAEMMPKEERAYELSRMTAYFICDQFNLLAVSKFLKENHGVKPRMYDEALYVPYSLPLLPGAEGFRVKSNNSAKLLPNKKLMESLINRSEQTDHLYEYYSGVETPEDANNYSMDPELEPTNNNFDPSEPQFFAPPELKDGEGKDKEIEKPVENRPLELSSPKSISPPANGKYQADFSRHHAEMFVFAYGIVVFWNFSEIHEKNILADLAFALDEPVPLLINPINEQDIETEEFHFEYDNQIIRPRIYNDMITLRSGDHLIKLTMSHAIAQLTKLCLFESRMVNILQLISKLPKKLALTGLLGLKRTQLLRKSGKLFKLRVDVNLSSSILDTPDYFWSFEPALHPLYTAVREYLEIEQRVQVLNDRCKVFLEFLDIVSDSINEKNTNRITWMIIIIIFISLSVSLFEFGLQMVTNPSKRNALYNDRC